MKNIIKKFFSVFSSSNFLLKIKQIIENNSYIKLDVLNHELIFFCPNILSKWRVQTIHSKEPETLEWIDNFNQKEKIVFWDIGANIGLYSIYAATKHKDIDVISFEPSSSNLRILSRNISINNYEKKIKIFQIPLSDTSNHFSMMKESSFIEGGAMNAYAADFDFEGKKFISKMNYSIFGTNINSLLNQKILQIPNYVKIDVDGIEHLILNGANKYLIDNKLQGLLIEINENFEHQKKSVIKIMQENNFKLVWKKNNDSFFQNKKFKHTFNYYFSR